MVKLNKLEIEIWQGGESTQEYEDPATRITQDTITRYVEIKEGHPFVIIFARDLDYDLSYYDTFVASLSLDGQCCETTVIPKGGMREKDGRFYIVINGFDKMIKGRRVFQQLRFKEAELGQAGSHEILDELRQRYEHQGTICVEISQCLSEMVSDDGDSSDEEKEETQSLVPKEIAKEKGSTSTASFETIDYSDPDDSDDEIFYTPVRECTEESVVAKFQFKYRTIEALYDQQIVPRPEKDIATLRAEFEELQREHEQLKQKVKKEEAEKLAGSFKERKKRKHMQNLENGEVELIEERPAHRRKPNADDVVIALDD